MEYARIIVERDGPVQRVTLNRPEVHNAFDELLIAELTACFEQLAGDTECRVAVLAGAGKSFCAGADLAYMSRVAAFSQEENLADAREMQRMFAAIDHCPQVTIARVHGAAIGGGVGLLCACDVAVASEDAKFALTEVRLGLAPAVISPYVLRRIGPGATRPLVLCAARIGAIEAITIGLVNEITPAHGLDASIDDRIESVIGCSPAAIAAAKRLLREIAGLSPEAAAETTAACIAALRAAPEGQEGIAAFLQKRKPYWAE